ncbi:vacuolar cation/proton exchanger [Trifolium repens]|nr:vacuolar cation/proton exchanger [Trifolium repens]
MSFKVKFHYGGQFVRDCLLYYQGGQEYDKDDNDPDRWSLFEIKGILKDDCHVEGKYRIWWYRNSGDRYISIVDDNDAYEVVKYASEMNTQVEIFVDHSCKGIAASNPIPIPTPIPDHIPAPNQSTRQANVDDTTVNDGNDDDEGGGEHDSDDSSYYGSDSSEDEVAGIHFDDSEDERALGFDDGFGIDLEEQLIPLQICDVKRRDEFLYLTNKRD